MFNPLSSDMEHAFGKMEMSFWRSEQHLPAGNGSSVHLHLFHAQNYITHALIIYSAKSFEHSKACGHCPFVSGDSKLV
jgi:hypothetical protein